jgi:glycogen synthase
MCGLGQHAALTARHVCHAGQAAVTECDALLTVSAGYAQELCTDHYMGCGLQDAISARGITGERC